MNNFSFHSILLSLLHLSSCTRVKWGSWVTCKSHSPSQNSRAICQLITENETTMLINLEVSGILPLFLHKYIKKTDGHSLNWTKIGLWADMFQNKKPTYFFTVLHNSPFELLAACERHHIALLGNNPRLFSWDKLSGIHSFSCEKAGLVSS